MLHKKAKVEFYPLGVIGAIVSWNYPFHNVFNPMLAAIFSGNAAVIKVSHQMLLFCTPFVHIHMTFRI
jgi:acyl-CoA reductase-like NAD-dependent aldehyde dehydrogenase